MQSLHDFNGRVVMTADSVVVQDLAGKWETGEFRVSGRADLDRFRFVGADVRLEANAVPLEVPNVMDALVDADIRFSGGESASQVRGRLVLLEGVYYKDMNLGLLSIARGAMARRRKVAPTPKQKENRFLANMDLNVGISRRQPFLVDNNLARIEIQPDLRITGSAARPLLSGRAEVLPGGTIEFQKKTFVVQRGVIDFLNPYKIEPKLDIRSESKIKRWTVYLHISGVPDELEFELSSTPHEEQGDIISLILFGKTTKQLVEGGGSTQTPAQMVAELVGSTYGDEIKRKTGLDIFRVETGSDGDDASEAITVTMGKHLTRRLTVLYSLETESGEFSSRMAAEYKLFERFLAGAFQDTSGEYGGELTYRIEFW